MLLIFQLKHSQKIKKKRIKKNLKKTQFKITSYQFLFFHYDAIFDKLSKLGKMCNL